MNTSETQLRDVPSPAAAPQSSSMNSNDMDGATTITIGSAFAFAIMGTVPMVIAAWFIRQLVVRCHHDKQQTRLKKQKQLQQINEAITGRNKHHDDNVDTSTSSIRSFQRNSEEFQSLPAKILNTQASVALGMSPPSQQVSSPATSIQAQKQSEPSSIMHPKRLDEATDGDDTITARLYENCVRLQQSQKFPIHPKVVGGTLDSKEAEARAKEYRRACRPKRMYFDEIVPSDVELGLQKSRSKLRNDSVPVKDELLNPTKRDTGIISRYFGMSNAQRRCSNEDDKMCPNSASISSGSSSSSSFGLSDNNSFDNDDGYYDANLYDDFRELGELVDI
jgi:hypothetical protein